MLNFIKGASLDNHNDLLEGYTVSEHKISANVNAEKIRSLIDSFADLNKDKPLFVFIEIPSNLKDEHNLTQEDDHVYTTDMLHTDVYYLDGISSEAVKMLLDPFYGILINDGLSAFGIGSSDGEEIGKYKYNIMHLYYNKENLNKYCNLFESHNISISDNLVTAWNLISETNPGTCDKFEDEHNRDIYDVVKVLEEVGMYKAEQRENLI